MVMSMVGKKQRKMGEVSIEGVKISPKLYEPTKINSYIYYEGLTVGPPTP